MKLAKRAQNVVALFGATRKTHHQKWCATCDKQAQKNREASGGIRDTGRLP